MSARTILPLLLLAAASRGGAATATAAAPKAAAPKAAAPKAAASSGAIPSHPSKLAFKPLDYPAPHREQYRHVLSDGVVVYVVEDHGLPLVDLTVTARGGDAHDPDGKAGLAAITADQMRSGGAGDMDADAFDQAVDFLALQMGIGSGPRESTAGINVLSKDLEKGLDLLFLALQKPRFQPDRTDLYKTQAKQAFEHRNDSTTTIESREWKRLVYGDDHFESRQPTSASVDAITREDMVAFHDRVWNPSNLLIAVSGDVKAADVLASLERRLASWPAGEKTPAAPKPTHVPQKGVWIVDKPDVNQSRVSVGQLATTWDDPRRPQLEVMNEILGSGGFTSRIMRSVRSNEGLAYSAGSNIGFGRDYPQSFRAAFQSKNQAVPRALAITMGEIARMRTEPVTADELDTAKTSLVETFPQRFASAQAKADIFVNDEIIGRPDDYWAKYRPAIQGVDAAAVQKAATELLHPDQLTVLVVGKESEVLAGDADHPDYHLSTYAGPEGVLEIGLPDPSTLAYPAPPHPVASSGK